MLTAEQGVDARELVENIDVHAADVGVLAVPSGVPAVPSAELLDHCREQGVVSPWYRHPSGLHEHRGRGLGELLP